VLTESGIVREDITRSFGHESVATATSATNKLRTSQLAAVTGSVEEGFVATLNVPI